MSKKEIKLMNIKAVSKLIEQDKISKLYDLVERRMIDSEAIRFLLDDEKHCLSVFYRVYNEREFYHFDDIYTSFEDYIKSVLAKKLYDNGESGEYRKWITSLCSTSKELFELFNSVDALYKNIIYKTLLYRKRNFNLNPAIQDKYLNCLDAMVEIYKYCTKSFQEEESYDFLSKWACVIDRRFIDSVEEKFGKEKTVKLIISRVDYRYNYVANLVGLKEAKDVFSYLEERESLNDVFRYVIYSITPAKSCGGIKTRKASLEREYSLSLQQGIYDSFVSSKIENDFAKIDKCFREEIGGSAATLLIFEKDEDKKNSIFNIGIKTQSLESISSNIIYANSYYEKIEITDYMEKISKLFSNRLGTMLLKTKVNNAEDFISLMGCVNRRLADGFSSNGFALDAIDLNSFSKDDIEDIATMLDWDNCHEYFEDSNIPYDFIKKNKDRISSESIGTTLSRPRGLEAGQILGLLNEYGENSFSDYTKRRIAVNNLEDREDLTPELIAKLIDMVPDGYILNPSCFRNKNIDLSSVLTLL